MNSTPTRGWYLVWPALIIGAGLVLHVFNPAGVTTRMQDLALGVFEHFKPRLPDPASATPVRYVDIGFDSIAARGPWPWPRSDIAKLIDALGSAGAKLVVLDLPLDGRDPVSPGRLAQGLPDTADGMALRATYGMLPDPDLALASAMTRTPTVTRFDLSTSSAGDAAALGEPLKADPRALRWLTEAKGAALPFTPIAEKSAGIGASLISRAGDSIYRLPLVVNVGGVVRPTLLLEAARLAEGAPAPEVQAFEPVTPQDRWLGRPGPASLTLGSHTIPLTRNGELVFHASAAPPMALSAARILAGNVPDSFKDAVVVVGASGSALEPQLRTPPGTLLPPAAILAEGLSQVVGGRFVTRPLWADAGEELFIFASGLAICLLLLYAPLAWPILTGAAAVGGVAALSWLAFSRELWFLDPLVPGVTLGLALVLGVHGRLQAEAEAEAESAPVMSGLIPAPAPGAGRLPGLKPAVMADIGERKPVTILACEIRGFNALMQRYEADPSALTRLIAAYHETITDVVVRNKGAVAVLRGPYVLAYWNGAVPDPEHAASACNCALRLIGAFEKMNETLAGDGRFSNIGFEPVSVGVGIESGTCVVGQTTGGRPELIAVGPTVEVAELLRERSAAYGPVVLVGQETRNEAEKLFALLEIDLLRVPCRDEAIHIYALMGNPLVRASPKFRALEATHQEIFQAYRAQNWSLARALVNECRKLPAAADKLYDLYDSRITELERIPPGPGWDGAHSLEAA